MKFRYILLGILLFCLNVASAQYVDRGQDPASIKWKQIKTKNFQLIYPANCEKSAQYYANILDVLYKEKASSLGHSPRKVSIIMHTHGGISNGTVYWAPASLELYTTPPQDGDFQLWAEHLACHEFRHVVQIDKLNQGMTKFLNIFFGEQATAVVLGAYVPMWFLEGDAVTFETSMTKAGRGRLPKFEQEVRAQLVEKGIYSYDKAVLGSFKDYIPNRYYLGYYMVANARKNYGTVIWESALSRVGRNPFGVTSFASGINEVLEPNRKKVWDKIGARLAKYDSRFMNVDSMLRANRKADAKVTLYKDNMTELQAEWKYLDKPYEENECLDFTPRKKVYTSYRFPHYTGNGGIISLKSGMADATYIVEILPGRRERKIFEPGYGVSKIDYNDGKIVWSEYKPHLRWENGGRHIIVEYDIRKKKAKRYKYEYNLFAPSINSKGNIVAVGNRTDNSIFLTFLDKEKWNIVIDAKNNEQFQSPCWINNKEVAIVVLDNNGKHIELVNLENSNRSVVFNPQMADISGLSFKGGKLLFNASFSGKDELYCYDIESKELNALTDSRFGSVDVDINEEGNILYSTYSADGYCVKESSFEKKVVSMDGEFKLAEIVSKQEKGLKPFQIEKYKTFKTKKYNKTTHLLHFHSWAPIFIDGIERETKVGVSVASQNMLSTMSLVAGYKDDEDYKNGAGYFNINFKAWWPIIKLKGEFGVVDYEPRGAFKVNNKKTGEEEYVAYWGDRDRKELEVEIELPFDISCGKYSRKITPMIEYSKIYLSSVDIDLFARYFEEGDNLKAELANKDDYDLSSLNTDVNADFLTYKIFTYNLKKTAMRDIGYRWGQILEAGYMYSVGNDVDFGYTYFGEGLLYFSGIGKHDNLEMYLGYQYFDRITNSGGVFYSREISSPRGMRLYGKELKSLKTTYSTPLCYPDFNLGSLVYLKRISGGLFYDYGFEKKYIENSFVSRNYFSAGGEIKADVNFLRLTAPTKMGLRVGYENKSKSVFTEFIYSMSFSF